MSAVLTSPEDIINAALVRIGYKQRIGSLFEGSDAAKKALDIYGQTRDQMLREGDWGFARRDVTMTLLKSAPAGGYIPPTVWTNAYPLLPWSYEYAYPGDCLKVRNINGTPLFLPEFLPKATVYSIANDNAFSPARKVILTNVPPPGQLTYTGQVTDPATWEVSFLEALIASLGHRLAPALVDLKAEQLLANEEQTEIARTKVEQG